MSPRIAPFLLILLASEGRAADPPLLCPSDQTFELGSGECSYIYDYTITVGPGLTAMQTSGLPPGSEFPIGMTRQTFVAMSGAAVVASCQFDVLVLEHPGPHSAPVCAAEVHIALGEEGWVWVGAGMLLEGGPYRCFDNYGVNKLVGEDWHPGFVTAADAGGERVFRVMDFNTGDWCQTGVTVSDPIPPTFDCPDDIVVEAAPTTCGGVPVHYVVTATDNGSSPTVVRVAGPASGSTFPPGVTSMSFLATDPAGNTATCAFTITVEDLREEVCSDPGGGYVLVGVETQWGEAYAACWFEGVEGGASPSIACRLDADGALELIFANLCGGPP